MGKQNVLSRKYLLGQEWSCFLARLQVLARWPWPTPMMLRSLDDFRQDAALGLYSWDPRINGRDKFHHMPIITPAYPPMNSAYNVSEATLRVMKVSSSPHCKQFEQRSVFDLRGLWGSCSKLASLHWMLLTVCICSLDWHFVYNVTTFSSRHSTTQKMSNTLFL